MTDVVKVDFKVSEPYVREFYKGLEEALEACPPDMAIATIIGTIEIFKANLMISYQSLED